MFLVSSVSIHHRVMEQTIYADLICLMHSHWFKLSYFKKGHWNRMECDEYDMPVLRVELLHHHRGVMDKRYFTVVQCIDGWFVATCFPYNVGG